MNPTSIPVKTTRNLLKHVYTLHSSINQILKTIGPATIIAIGIPIGNPIKIKINIANLIKNILMIPIPCRSCMPGHPKGLRGLK